MKKPNVLNRSMFNRGVTSAYGRGITSNLVSDKQRQRYNYGGRVGLRFGTPKIDYEDQYRIIDGNKIPKKYLDQEYPQPSFIPQVKEWWNLDEEDTGLPSIEDLQSEEYYGPTGNYKPYQIGTATGVRGSENPILARGTGEKGDVWIGDVGEEIQEFPELEQGGSSKLQVASELEAAKKAAEERALNVPIIDQAKNQEDAKLLTDDDIPRSRRLDSDLLDIEGIIDKYYDKKTPLGEAQLGLAGSVLAAGFEGDKKKAASILGGGVSKFGTTLAGQAKERSKLGATLEGQREIYRQSRIAEGEQDRETARIKEEMLQNRPEKNSSLADQFKFFKTQTKDYGKAVKLTLGDKVISISDDIDITTMKKDPSKIYKIRIGGNDIYKMYDDNGQEIEDFNIEEYITKLS